MMYLGVDPGRSGAMAVVSWEGSYIDHIKLNETDHDICNWIRGHAPMIKYAVLEKVHAMPRQGVSSTFKFGVSFGLCRGFLVANLVSYEEFTPATWQRSLRCLSKGDKNVTKSKAQELFPNVKVTHAIADALLIAEFARRESCAHKEQKA